MSKFRFELVDPEFEARKAHERKVYERRNKQHQQFWNDLASKCWKIARIQEPRERQMAAEAYFVDMQGEPPRYLTRYLQQKQLPPVGEFEEVPKGIVSSEVLWDDDDVVPKDKDGKPYIYEV